MKFAVLLTLLLLTECAAEKVACKDVDMNGVPCTVCTRQNWSVGVFRPNSYAKNFAT